MFSAVLILRLCLFPVLPVLPQVPENWAFCLFIYTVRIHVNTAQLLNQIDNLFTYGM